MSDARVVCARVIADVIQRHKHLDDSIAGHSGSLKDPRERRLARELCYGTIRWYPRLVFISRLLLARPLKDRDADIQALICAGLYQLGYLRVPDHAAISATVEAARKLDKSWASKLINAVLRRYQRDREGFDDKADASEEARLAHPQWLINLIRREWPAQWEPVLRANNEYPPLQLRVNLARQDRADYLQRLAQAGIEAVASDLVETGITLAKPVNVEEIPGFMDGMVSVQDYGAQLAAILLDAGSGHRVLDACAAPGGKTGHILERARGGVQVTAVESDANRLSLVRDNLARLGLQAAMIHADAADVSTWWDGVPFDRILLDAPCSATGVIRRHPDIKLLRTPEQLEMFTSTQKRLLESLWPLLKPGGRMLYSTCSIIHAESDDQIASFTNKYDDTRLVPIADDRGIASRHGLYLLPGNRQTDGFYYSLMEKIAGQ